MGRAVRFQEILRRLAVVDEGFVGDQAGLVLGLPGGERPLAASSADDAGCGAFPSTATGLPSAGGLARLSGEPSGFIASLQRGGFHRLYRGDAKAAPASP